MAKKPVLKLLAISMLLLSGGLSYTGSAFAQAQACDRTCLQSIADQFLDALSRRDPADLPLAESLRYTENGRTMTLGQGVWHTVGVPWTYRDYVLDPETGGVLVFTAFDEYEGVLQLAVRLKIESRRISEIETIVARIGDQQWFDPEALNGLSDVFSTVVPDGSRSTRAELNAVADAYFTAVQTEGTPEFEQAPFGALVKRFENGFQTTHVTENPVNPRHTLHPGEQLERAYYRGTVVADRRFPLVDIEKGIAVGMGAFRREGTDSNTLLLAEIFKVVDGQIQEIRAVILDLPNGASTGWE